MAEKKVKERKMLLDKMHDQYEKDLKSKSLRYLQKIEDAE